MAVSQKGRRALAVLTDLPFPPRSGNHLRYLQQLRLLSGLGYEVFVTSGITRLDGQVASQGPVGSLESTLVVEPLPTSATARLRRMAWLAGASLGIDSADPSVLAHRAAGFDDIVLDSITRVRPDLVVIPNVFTHLVERIKTLNCVVIVDVHDSSVLGFDMLRRQATGLERLALVLHTAAARRGELPSLMADEVWAASRREFDYYERRFPGLPRVLVPNGVPVPPLSAASPAEAELLLVANYGWAPNLKAAETLVEQILPRVRARIPQMRAKLIGKGLTSELRARWADSPVDYLDEVEDVEPHVRAATAVVFAPPRWAETALPLKLAEALAWGTPIVVTPWPVNASGLEPYTEAIVSADIEVLSAQTAELVSSPLRREQLRERGHRWACENLATEAILKRLRVESAAARG